MNITIIDILWWFLSVVAIFSALMMVTSKNPVYSVLWLIATFFAISGHYILLNAQFLAIVNIIVYAGAIMVLFLFVIMLMNLNKETEPQKNRWLKIAGAGGCVKRCGSKGTGGFSEPGKHRVDQKPRKRTLYHVCGTV